MKKLFAMFLVASLFLVGCGDGSPPKSMVVDAAHDLFEDTAEYLVFDYNDQMQPEVSNIYPVDRANGLYRASVEYPIIMTGSIAEIESELKNQNLNMMQQMSAGLALMQLNMMYADWEKGDYGTLTMQIDFQDGTEQWLYSLATE